MKRVARARLIEAGRQAAAAHGFALGELFSRRSGNRLVWAARRAVYAAMRATGASSTQIGEVLGRDHTTVLIVLRRAGLA